MPNLQLVEDVETYRDAAAGRIKQLMVDWTANTLALGAELAAAAERGFPVNPKRPTERPGFKKWAQQATGLSSGQISKLLQVHAKFGDARARPRLSQEVLVLLSKDIVPESARQEAVSRSEKGEPVTRKEAKKIAEKHKLPSAKAANEQAKEEGRPVLASDGFIYFGTDPAKAKEGEDRRKMVYGVKRALDTLGGIQLTARQFLAYAMPHQLWTDDEQKIIKDALRWLVSLDEAWDTRK